MYDRKELRKQFEAAATALRDNLQPTERCYSNPDAPAPRGATVVRVFERTDVNGEPLLVLRCNSKYEGRDFEVDTSEAPSAFREGQDLAYYQKHLRYFVQAVPAAVKRLHDLGPQAS